MSKSQRLRQQDYRDIFELVHECLELWASPRAWRQHLLDGLCRRTGGFISVMEEFTTAPGRPPQTVAWDVGGDITDADTASLYSAYEGLDRREMPNFEAVIGDFLQHGRMDLLRQRVCTHAELQDTDLYQRVLQPHDVFDFAVSMRPGTEPGRVRLMNLNTAHNEGQAPQRFSHYLAAVHDAVAPHIGTRLATEGQRTVDELTPRLRDVLDQLLDGHTEKDIALRLGIAPHTVHDYVKRLFVHFRVHSRPGLMAYFVHRRPS